MLLFCITADSLSLIYNKKKQILFSLIAKYSVRGVGTGHGGAWWGMVGCGQVWWGVEVHGGARIHVQYEFTHIPIFFMEVKVKHFLVGHFILWSRLAVFY